jgi:hypothetical protein
MINKLRIAKWSVVLGLIALTTSCIVAGPREGYWDHSHNRYWHANGWHDCTPEFCR